MSGPVLAEKQAHSHHACFCTAYSVASGVSSTVLTVGGITACFRQKRCKAQYKIKKGYCD